MRKFRRPSKHSKPRLAILGAVLVITLVWAQSEMGAARRPAAGRSPSAAAAAIPMPGGAIVAGDQATPGGWGADPFDPRLLGSTPVTTGR